MATAPVFRAALGLNNVVEPHRLSYREDGSSELAEAVNVIIDDSGSVKRRFGISQVFAGPVHSLWAKGEYCFFVSEGKLYRRTLGGSNVLVNASCGDDPMFFEEFGGKVFASNGTFRAVLYGSIIESYSASIPQQYASDTRVLGVPSTFTRMCAHAGRMYAVDGRFLWESEPFNPRCFNMATGFMDIGSDIVDLVAIRGGIYVSTNSEVKFLAGSSMADFVLFDAYDSPMVPGTCSRIRGDDVGQGDMIQGIGAVWVSQAGVCVGTEDGKVMNVTSRKLVFDSAISGSGAVLPGQYFFSLEVE